MLYTAVQRHYLIGMVGLIYCVRVINQRDICLFLCLCERRGHLGDSLVNWIEANFQVICKVSL